MFQHNYVCLVKNRFVVFLYAHSKNKKQKGLRRRVMVSDIIGVDKWCPTRSESHAVDTRVHANARPKCSSDSVHKYSENGTLHSRCFVPYITWPTPRQTERSGFTSQKMRAERRLVDI